MSIRTLTAGDEAALAVFFVANNCATIMRTFSPFPLDAATARRLCYTPGRDQFFAYFDGAAILGFGMLRGWNEGYETPSFGVLVDATAQRRGIGAALTRHALELAYTLGCKQVRLTVHEENSGAIRLYEKLGFLTTDVLPDGRRVMMVELG